MVEKTLQELVATGRYDTDKNPVYLANYERHLAPWRHRSISLLELGVYHGGSLKLWRDYFPQARILVGLDMAPIALEEPTNRIRLYRGFQQDTMLLDRIRDEVAPDGFDVIIDDASHIGELTAISFWHLFEHALKPGGLYVIEDWRTGYWPAFPDGARYHPPPKQGWLRSRLSRWLDRRLANEISESAGDLGYRFLRRIRTVLFQRRFPSHERGMVGFIKQLIDELGMDMITNPLRGGRGPQRMPRFAWIEVCPGQVFIKKALAMPPSEQGGV